MAAGVAVLLMACAVGVVRLVAGCTPGVDCGIETGYSPPASMVLVSTDGRTLWAGYSGCVEDAALQALDPSCLQPAACRSPGGHASGG